MREQLAKLSRGHDLTKNSLIVTAKMSGVDPQPGSLISLPASPTIRLSAG
jgi:hypothetical protein